MTVAPSRCSTCGDLLADARLAPVTERDPALERALPVRDLDGLGRAAVPTRMTWPETNADLGDSRKARVEAGGRLGALGDVDQLDGAAAADLLAELRVKPSSARCATRSPPSTDSGGVPSTTRRGQVSSRRISGVKKWRRAVRSVLLVSPVASNTSALKVASPPVSVVEAMPRRSSTGERLARRPVPPTATVPSTSGAPSTYRSRRTGLGRPRFLTQPAEGGLDEALVTIAHGCM